MCLLAQTDISGQERNDIMKSNEQVIAKLEIFLADELTAISQYMVHSEMCTNWGYQHLHEAIEKRAIDEMNHAEKLIGRILFLDRNNSFNLPLIRREFFYSIVPLNLRASFPKWEV
jgi:ferritin-like protein